MAIRSQLFRPSDVSKQALLQGVALSPDGEAVVYARRTIEGGDDRTRLWWVPPNDPTAAPIGSSGSWTGSAATCRG